MTTTTPEQNSAAQVSARPQTAGTPRRLPCRGCTRDCRHYSRCNGKPWRMP